MWKLVSWFLITAGSSLSSSWKRWPFIIETCPHLLGKSLIASFCSIARLLRSMQASPPLCERCRRWLAERGTHCFLCSGSLHLLQLATSERFTIHDYTEAVRRLSQLVGDLSVRLGPNTAVRAAAVLAPPQKEGGAPPSSSGGPNSVRSNRITSTYSPSPGQGRRRERHRRRRAREEGTGTDTEPPLTETAPLDQREARSQSNPRREASPSQEIKRRREYLSWDSSPDPQRSRTVCSQALRFQRDIRDRRETSPTELHRKTSSSSRRLFPESPELVNLGREKIRSFRSI